MGKRTLIITIGCLTVLVYLAFPYYASWALYDAVRDADEARIARGVDFERVRSSLRQQVETRLTRPGQSPLAKAVVVAMLDALVTPEGIARAVREGRTPLASPVDGSRITLDPPGVGAGGGDADDDLPDVEFDEEDLADLDEDEDTSTAAGGATSPPGELQIAALGEDDIPEGAIAPTPARRTNGGGAADMLAGRRLPDVDYWFFTGLTSFQLVLEGGFSVDMRLQGGWWRIVDIQLGDGPTLQGMPGL